jgi:hypothetical protein
MANERTTLPREAQVAYAELRKGVAGLGRAIAQAESAFRATERRIEADARQRIRELRREAKGQMSILEGRRREAARILRRLSRAAGGSWHDVKQAGDRTLADARSVADAVVARFRRALRT